LAGLHHQGADCDAARNAWKRVHPTDSSTIMRVVGSSKVSNKAIRLFPRGQRSEGQRLQGDHARPTDQVDSVSAVYEV